MTTWTNYRTGLCIAMITLSRESEYLVCMCVHNIVLRALENDLSDHATRYGRRYNDLRNKYEITYRTQKYPSK